MNEQDVLVKRVEPVWALTKRVYVDGIGELAGIVEVARKEVGSQLVSPPLALLLERDEEKGIRVELAMPANRSAQRRGYTLQEIPPDHVLSTVHVGPYRGGEEGKNLIDTVRAVWAFIGERQLLAGDNPSRYVFLEGPEVHGEDATLYRTEIQVSYHLPVWQASLETGVRRAAGDDAAAAVMAGQQELEGSYDADSIRNWVLGAVRRLDETPMGEPSRDGILQDCAHHYPQIQLKRLREAYDEIGDLRSFIDRLREDRALFPATIWLDESGERPLVYIQRSVPPWNREAYDATDDPVEKRYHSCFCVMVREAIRTGETVSPSFCNCSGGWFVQMWEAILDRRLPVEVVESVLRGDDRCLFAVCIPPELLC